MLAAPLPKWYLGFFGFPFMSGKIFINYRRGDEPGFTQALFARLEQAFSSEQLFMDVDNIPPGEDFVRMLDTQVEQCDALLAVIGKGWLNATDENENRRLDDPNDFVRIEIESALKQGKRVIPILVNDARMPRPDDLPELLRPLTRRNAVRLTHERFRADALSLVKALQRSLEEAEALRVRADQQRKEEEEAARLRSLQEAQAKQRADKQRESAARASDIGHEHDAELRADAMRRTAKRERKAELEALQRKESELNKADFRPRTPERHFFGSKPWLSARFMILVATAASCSLAVALVIWVGHTPSSFQKSQAPPSQLIPSSSAPTMNSGSGVTANTPRSTESAYDELYRQGYVFNPDDLAASKQQPSGAGKSNTYTLAGTTWGYEDGGYSDNTTNELARIEFLRGGKVKHTGTGWHPGSVKSGSWKQSGDSVHVDLTDGVKFDGTILGNTITGRVWYSKDSYANWFASKY